MANIHDYLDWRGDLKIDRCHPFNDVDAMILARFSYLLFDKIKLSNRETVETVAKKMQKFKNSDFRWDGDRELIAKMGASRRFRHMKVTDYEKQNDRAAEKQFSAITIHINYAELFISFLGTDDTITGWKEDFNLTFMEVVPAQLEGLKYLKKIARKYYWRKIRIGGHSKGGTIAMFAAVMANDRLQHRLTKVYNFDGPGLKSSLAAKDVGESVLPKIVSFVPQDSVFGRLFQHTEEYRVVQADAERNIYEHDLYSWQVTHNGIIESTITKRSDMVNETLTRWLESATQEQRKIFIDGVFEILYKSKVKTPMKLADNWHKYLLAFIKNYNELSKEDRKVMTEVLKKLMKSLIATREKARKEKTKVR